MSLLKIQSCLECLERLARVGGVRIDQDEWERETRGKTKEYRRCPSPSSECSCPYLNNFLNVLAEQRGRNLRWGEAAAQNWREASGCLLPGEGDAAQCQSPGRASSGKEMV